MGCTSSTEPKSTLNSNKNTRDKSTTTRGLRFTKMMEKSEVSLSVAAEKQFERLSHRILESWNDEQFGDLDHVLLGEVNNFLVFAHEGELIFEDFLKLQEERKRLPHAKMYFVLYSQLPVETTNEFATGKTLLVVDRIRN